MWPEKLKLRRSDKPGTPNKNLSFNLNSSNAQKNRIIPFFPMPVFFSNEAKNVTFFLEIFLTFDLDHLNKNFYTSSKL